MAIVEMQKLKLYGASADKQKILDALFETQLVSLKKVEEIENTKTEFKEDEYTKLENKRARLERAIVTIETKLEALAKKEKVEYVKDFDLTIKEFEAITSKQDFIEKKLNELDQILAKQNDLNKQRTSIENKIIQLTPYLAIKENFSDFKTTKHASFLLGTINQNAIKDFESFLKDFKYTAYEITDGSVIRVYSHKLESEQVLKKLSELGFSKAPFNDNKTSTQLINEEKENLSLIAEQEKILSNKICSFNLYLKDIKTLHDYVSFLMSKLDAENKFRNTKASFVLEAYFAKENKDKLDNKLKNSGYSIEYEFLEIEKDEIPPTITKNNKVVKQFEFVTNMYSAPHYRELDPNTFIAIFFSIFFGFVMADIGYGIVLFIFGLSLALKQKRETGFKQLMYVIAIGGIFTIIFGLLFGSFFGLSHEQFNLVPVATIPNPVDNVITLLVACLGAGVVQIMVSLVLKGVLLIKRKHVPEAIFTAFCWDFFFVGLILFVLDFAGLVKGLFLPGVIIAGISVATSFVGQIIINKGFNRISKSFGALYGIINFFSDILSYARLFGLMLSGAIIASIVNDLASGFLTSISTFLVGIIILAIGHSFNLAMGALGGYIHVARLQYIEFFSRFYEGEGEVFVPFGTEFSYVKLI